jgi:Xaa-Pro aminopeptidase
MLPLKRHEDSLVPASEIENRIAALQSAIQTMDLAGAWISHLADRFYYSGSIQDATLLVPAMGATRYFVRKSRARAEAESSLRVLPFPGRKGLLKEARTLLGSRGRLGLPLDVLPAATYVWLAGELGEGRLADISGALRQAKAVKSDWEVAQIRAAAEQANAVLPAIGELVLPGMSELALSAAIEARLRILGHAGTLRVRRIGVDLDVIYAVAGDSALYPTNFDGPVGGEGPFLAAPAGAGWKEIVAGETLMVDMVTSSGGYFADNARTYMIRGETPPAAEAAHAFCLEAMARIERGLRPGQCCANLFHEVAEWAEREGEPEGFMGFGENRVKFFGHGIGLELDELPIIAGKIDLELQAGMVVAVEPKAFLTGIGPVGAENTYVINEDGCESLCTVGREIIGIP